MTTLARLFAFFLVAFHSLHPNPLWFASPERVPEKSPGPPPLHLGVPSSPECLPSGFPEYSPLRAYGPKFGQVRTVAPRVTYTRAFF